MFSCHWGKKKKKKTDVHFLGNVHVVFFFFIHYLNETKSINQFLKEQYLLTLTLLCLKALYRTHVW